MYKYLILFLALFTAIKSEVFSQSINTEFEAKIANFEKYAKRNHFAVQLGISCNYVGKALDCVTCRVSCYQLTIVRNGTLIYTVKEDSPYLNEDTKNALKDLMIGDIVVVSDIYITFSTKTIKVSPVVYEII